MRVYFNKNKHWQSSKGVELCKSQTHLYKSDAETAAAAKLPLDSLAVRSTMYCTAAETRLIDV